MKFAKYQGAGNDFIIVSDHDTDSVSNAAKRLCRRRYGVGADGVILVRCQAKSQATITCFNPDGSVAEMCGNGLRCASQFLIDRGCQDKKLLIDIGEKRYFVLVEGRDLVVDMGAVSILEEGILDGISYIQVDSGTPHLVHFCEEIQSQSFARVARHLRFHKRFDPVGVNVNFVRVLSSQLLEVRTYEKGVEGETLSCGTGATAACVAAWRKYGIQGEMQVKFCSGERLACDLLEKGGALWKVNMRGQAVCVYRGEWKG